jgi:hypothetical protein
MQRKGQNQAGKPTVACAWHLPVDRKLTKSVYKLTWKKNHDFNAILRVNAMSQCHPASLTDLITEFSDILGDEGDEGDDDKKIEAMIARLEGQTTRNEEQNEGQQDESLSLRDLSGEQSAIANKMIESAANDAAGLSLGLFESGRVVQQVRRFDGSTFLKAWLIQALPHRYLGRFWVKHEYYTCIWTKCPPFIRSTTRGFQNPHLIQH